MQILIAGVPGAGKTTICKRLAELYSIDYFDISKIIVEEELYEKKNAKLDTYEFEPKIVRRHIRQMLKNTQEYVVETHTPEIVKKTKFDHVFVLVIPLKELHKRLTQRKYNDAKIQENLDCAIYNEVGYDCETYFDNVTYIGNETETYSIEQTIQEIQVHIIQKM